jgi:hypothetical protein
MDFMQRYLFDHETVGTRSRKKSMSAQSKVLKLVEKLQTFQQDFEHN